MSTHSIAAKVASPPKLALIAVVILLIAGLATLDKFLANAQDQELQNSAQTAYEKGMALRKAGNLDQAIDSLRKAYSLERQNKSFTLELAATLLADHKLDEAERLIQEVLERNSNDGRANLLTAHLMEERGLRQQAESYFHRAIYGEWPTDAVDHRLSARLELIDFLAAIPERKDLLAELLALPDDMKKTPALQLHLGQLFLIAGSPARAIDQYRSVISQIPNDAAAYTGLGNAELETGNYSRARDAFVTASKTRMDDPIIKGKMDLTVTLAALDPTSRRLTSLEKYRRSLEILGMARISLGSCLASHPGQQKALLEALDDALVSKPRQSIANETAEGVLTLAEKAWQARVEICGQAATPDEEPLRLMMGRLSRER